MEPTDRSLRQPNPSPLVTGENFLEIVGDGFAQSGRRQDPKILSIQFLWRVPHPFERSFVCIHDFSARRSKYETYVK